MNAETPPGESHASTSTAADAVSETAGGADAMSLHALAIAADPALAGLPGTGQPHQAYDGDVLAQADQGDADAYDGHVALVLDPGLLPDMDSMLDLLTTSHDLFDVPAMDTGGALDDTTAA